MLALHPHETPGFPRARSRRDVAGRGAPRADSERSERRRTAGLDNTTKNVSRDERAKRRERARLRSVLWRESSLSRLQMCGRRRVKESKVGIYKSDRGAYFANVQHCGSVHSCPVCAPKIRQRRAQEIDNAVRSHIAAGYSVAFQTLTLPHDFGDDLDSLLSTVADAFRKVIGGRGYVDDKRDYAITGTIRSSETTFGKAGAHPHLHVLFFSDRQLSDRELRAFNARLFSRWSSAVQRAGYRAPLIGLCPLDRVTSSEVGMYVTKIVGVDVEDSPRSRGRRVGMEMTRHDLKTARRAGRTPFQVLRDFAESGDCDDLALWHKWERASRGTQSLTWSRGLKARYNVVEKTDEEIAAEQVGGALVTELTPAQWNLINAEELHVDVLEIAEESGDDGLQLWLDIIGLRRSQRMNRLSAQSRAA
ncbi:MAG TPA: hypothetical protein VKA60_27605 [Blastocatellia bacterium]|nr:hypothetical protein [Blastocatellia bacterium]